MGRLGTSGSLDEIAAYLGRALPIVRRLHERLAATSPPGSLAGSAELTECKLPSWGVPL